MIKGFCKMFVSSKMSDYKWLAVNYDWEEDVLFLSPTIIQTLKGLAEKCQITKVGYTWNCLYLLQSIYAPESKNGNLFKNVFASWRTYSESEKAELQQRTLAYLQQSDFLSQFSQY